MILVNLCSPMTAKNHISGDVKFKAFVEATDKVKFTKYSSLHCFTFKVLQCIDQTSANTGSHQRSLPKLGWVKDVPSRKLRELTYPTWGKGTSSSNMPYQGDMLISWRVINSCPACSPFQCTLVDAQCQHATARRPAREQHQIEHAQLKALNGNGSTGEVRYGLPTKK